MHDELQQLQSLFLSVMRSPYAPTDATCASFASPRTTSVRLRLEVYRKSWWAKQHEVLAALHPKLVEHVGSERFRALATAYLASGPDTRAAVESLGMCFADWLSTQHDITTTDVELARFEFACFEAAIAPDDAAVSLSSVDASFALAAVRIARHVRVLPKEGASLVVWRQQGQVVHRTITAGEGDALRGACDTRAEGRSVVELCTALSADGDAAHVQRVLSAWFARGWITALLPGA